MILYFCLQHTATHKKTSLPLKNRAHPSTLPGSPRSRALRRTAAQPCSPRRRARAGLARHAAAARRGEERQKAGEPPHGGSSTAGAPACRSRTGVTAPSHRLDAPPPPLPEGATPEAACRAATEGGRNAGRRGRELTGGPGFSRAKKSFYVLRCVGDKNIESQCAVHKFEVWSVRGTKSPFENVPQTNYPIFYDLDLRIFMVFSEHMCKSVMMILLI